MDEGLIIAQRYRLGRRLGEGGMGVVYEAEHVVTGRKLAVKVLERREKLPEDAVDRFRREASAPAKIGHANVVEVIDAGTEPDGTLFIAMELLEGETLETVMRRDHVVQPATLAAIMDQLLDGLEAMHSRSYVHRDLKPANIFLCRAPNTPLRVKLLDFGIAKALGEEARTRSGYVIGTPAYMAPEQMRNARGATARSDLWSVGVILYECLVGHRPFRGETFGLLAQISGPGEHVSLGTVAPALPRDLTDLVDRLLSKNAAARPGSARELRDVLLPMLARCPAVVPIAPTDDDASDPVDPASASTERGETPPASPWAHGPDASALADVGGRPISEAFPLEHARPAGIAWRVAIAAVVVAIAAGVGSLALHGAAGHGDRSHGSHDHVATDGSVRVEDNRELNDFLLRWRGTVIGTQGAASLAPFYTDPVRFGGNGVASLATVERRWGEVFENGGSFAVDLHRSSFTEEPVDLNTTSTACVNVAGATGRVFRVRAQATERVQDRSAAVGCQRLDGIYLMWIRRVSGSLRICHETWSLTDGICASCPTAPACRDAGT